MVSTAALLARHEPYEIQDYDRRLLINNIRSSRPFDSAIPVGRLWIMWLPYELPRWLA